MVPFAPRGGTHAITRSLGVGMSKMPYGTDKAFAPVVLIGISPNVLPTAAQVRP